jgi:hypothetical protein
MSTISGVNYDSQTFDCLCLRFYPPQKPLSPKSSTINREDITIINCVKKLANRLHGYRRKYAGNEASQFKVTVEALQA